MVRTCGTVRKYFRRMLKNAAFSTRPTLAVTSPARPESAKTVSLPRDTPCPKQGRNSVADPRFTPHGYWERCENEAGRFFSILLELVERLIPEDSKRFSCV